MAPGTDQPEDQCQTSLAENVEKRSKVRLHQETGIKQSKKEFVIFYDSTSHRFHTKIFPKPPNSMLPEFPSYLQPKVCPQAASQTPTGPVAAATNPDVPGCHLGLTGEVAISQLAASIY